MVGKDLRRFFIVFEVKSERVFVLNGCGNLFERNVLSLMWLKETRVLW